MGNKKGDTKCISLFYLILIFYSNLRTKNIALVCNVDIAAVQ